VPGLGFQLSPCVRNRLIRHENQNSVWKKSPLLYSKPGFHNWDKRAAGSVAGVLSGVGLLMLGTVFLGGQVESLRRLGGRLGGIELNDWLTAAAIDRGKLFSQGQQSGKDMGRWDDGQGGLAHP